MKLYLYLLVVLFIGPAHSAWNDWSDTDRKWFIASTVAMTADWSTTRYAATRWKSCNCYEQNIILGPNPSKDKVDVYFIALLVSNYFIADMLPEKDRGFYFAVRTSVHGIAAYHNTVVLGWKFAF